MDPTKPVQHLQPHHRKPSYNRNAMIGFAIGAGLEAMVPSTNPDPALSDAYMGAMIGGVLYFFGINRELSMYRRANLPVIAKESALYAFAFTAGTMLVKLARPYVQ